MAGIEWQCQACGATAPHPASPGLPRCSCGAFSWRSPPLAGIGEPCPSPGCPHLLKVDPENLRILRCVMHGPMKMLGDLCPEPVVPFRDLPLAQ
jgi:hypothetical protein